MQSGTRSPTGVFVADDFRSNLIIDRYDVEFLSMRGSKTATMRSENSEDALTWNVFRSLAQVEPHPTFTGITNSYFETAGAIVRAAVATIVDGDGHSRPTSSEASEPSLRHAPALRKRSGVGVDVEPSSEKSLSVDDLADLRRKLTTLVNSFDHA